MKQARQLEACGPGGGGFNHECMPRLWHNCGKGVSFRETQDVFFKFRTSTTDGHGWTQIFQKSAKDPNPEKFQSRS